MPSDNGISTRPRALVERELEARITAQTAKGFLQRRRAAKEARRIAALPPSLFAAGVIPEPESAAWGPMSAAPPVVIDLPVSAIHDVKPAPVIDVPAEPEPVAPEPLALVAPVIEITTMEAAVVEEVEPAPNGESAPKLHRRVVAGIGRLRARRVPSGADDPPETPWFDEPLPSAATQTQPVVVREPEPEPVAIVPESEPEPEPEPIAIVPEPEPEPVTAADVTEVEDGPYGASAWEPSTSLWAQRVFNPRSQPVPQVTWPRPRVPSAPHDLANDYLEAEVAQPAHRD